ncbi:protein-disulfide reductase DsbD family protein [Tepidimonas charontis]|uniref:protein-disulfide reductase DsbD family protein n=1 Tax=Tepidimonas charontis TaxID=2267262 RepID=UPI002E264E92
MRPSRQRWPADTRHGPAATHRHRVEGWTPTLAALAAGLLMWPLAGAAQAPAVVQSEFSRVALVAYAPEGVAPGKPLWLGLRIEHAPEWHTYWKNPGDSGLPVQLQWTLPPGWEAGDIQWPTPRKFPLGELANYGYDGTVLLPVPVSVNAPVDGAVDVQLDATWLICRRECVPEEARLSLRLPANAALVGEAAAFEAAWAAAPQSVPAEGTLNVDARGLHLQVRGLPPAWRGQALEFFPEVGNLIAPGAPWQQRWTDDRWEASVPLNPYRTEAPTQLAFVLAPANPAGHGAGTPGVRLDWPVQGTWPPLTPAPALPTVAAPDTPAAPAATPSVGLGLALVGALLGGLILNLMPCVFPVLAIKIMAFQSHGANARAHRLGGLAYTAGVVASFLALGGLLLGLRTAGEAVGWGFQLQNPIVVAALASLFVIIGLNLAGVFTFGQLAPAGLAGLQLRHPLADAFLTGVLATAVASPCTAPFMGASLGLAVTLPATQALGVFAALGLGMALPYLAASWWPGLAQRLPRPGPWMETFRQAMAFPMFAAAVWLLWVLGLQNGVSAVAALLLILLALTWVLWAAGQRGGARRHLLATGALALIAAVVGLGPHVTRAASDAGPAVPTTDALWQPWSPERQAELLAQGRPVFVDFTAAWCVTCQVNKAAVLNDAAVLQEAAQSGIALLRADWTRRDPVIAEALAALGRNGVPVYVLHVPGQAPQIFSEILRTAEVRAAFAAVGRR